MRAAMCWLLTALRQLLITARFVGWRSCTSLSMGEAGGRQSSGSTFACEQIRVWNDLRGRSSADLAVDVRQCEMHVGRGDDQNGT